MLLFKSHISAIIRKNYRSQEETDFSVKLGEDTQALDEVVVVGYGTQKKVNLTGAVAKYF